MTSKNKTADELKKPLKRNMRRSVNNLNPITKPLAVEQAADAMQWIILFLPMITLRWKATIKMLI